MPPTVRGAVVRTRRAAAVKKWTLRWSNPPEDWEAVCEELFNEHFKFFVGQLEMSESGTPHVQGYFELKKRQRRSTVSALWGEVNPHFEEAKGNAKQNIRYCTKHCGACYKGDPCTGESADYQMSEPVMWGTPSKIGKAALMDGLWQAIEKGVDEYEMISETPALLSHQRAVNYAMEVRNRKLGNRWRTVQVDVLEGPPGVGKTLWPVWAHGYENIYILTKLTAGALWFDGYLGQKVLVIDDFDSDWSIPYRALLRLLDGHTLRLPIKGGFTYALFDHVYITTNVPVGRWYKKRSEIDALLRRIDRVVSVALDPFGERHAYADGVEVPFPRDPSEAPILPLAAEGGGEEGGTGGTGTGTGGNAGEPSVPAPVPFRSGRLRRANAFIAPSTEDALLLHNLRSMAEEDAD